MKEREEIHAHNNEMMWEYNKEEAGIGPKHDPLDVKKFSKEIKAELAQIRLHDSAKADHLEKMIFDRDTELDKALNVKIPAEEIKFYPGSIKGPEPEDDPEEWSKWYYEN